MSLILSGTDGLSDVDGSAATPAIRGTDANTGIFFGADIIGFAEGGAEVARFNADAQFVAAAGTASLPVITTTGDVNTGIFFPAADTIAFTTAGTEDMRIDSSGNVLINTTSTLQNGLFNVLAKAGGTGIGVQVSTNGNYGLSFGNASGTNVGRIQIDSGATQFVTTSDYRLKNSISPMTGALAKVALLKPCTYKWNEDNSDAEGFIAHELAEVCPQAVSGEKDAVDANGNIISQGIDTSFLVATLTSAIQEQQALITALTARITALETQSADNPPQGETP